MTSNHVRIYYYIILAKVVERWWCMASLLPDLSESLNALQKDPEGTGIQNACYGCGLRGQSIRTWGWRGSEVQVMEFGLRRSCVTGVRIYMIPFSFDMQDKEFV